MKQVGKLNPFGRFCCTIGNLPTSYMESLTYEEQLLWFCKFLDTEVIPAVNENADAIIELQNYLKNLDLQDYVNNKLDEMAEDGTLQNIIAEYLKISSVLIYNTLDDLKNAENIITGSYLKTKGFKEVSDLGSATYIVREVKNTDITDDITLIALSNYPNLVAELSESGTLRVEQFGIFENSNIDDKFDIMLNYAREKGLNIIFGKRKNYLSSKTINIDIYKDIIDFNESTIESSANTIMSFYNSHSGEESNNYEVLSTPIKNGFFKNTSTEDTIGLYLNSEDRTAAIAHISLHNISFSNCGVGVEINNNCYIVNFENCELHDNIIGLYILNGSNAGERITLSNSAVYNNTTGVLNINDNGNVLLTSSSVDYNTEVGLKAQGQGKYTSISCIGCHIEGTSQTFVGTILFDSCNFMALGNATYNDRYLFDVSLSTDLIQLINCNISGQYRKQFVEDLTQPGKIIFNNCRYSGGLLNFGASELNNNSKKYYKVFPNYRTAESLTPTSTNLSLAINSTYDELTVTKTASTGNSEVEILIPLTPDLKRRWKMGINIKTNQSGSEGISFTWQYCKLSEVYRDEKYSKYATNRIVAHSEIGITNTTAVSGYDIVAQNDNQDTLANSYDYLRIGVWCGNLTPGQSFVLSNFYLQEI